MLLNIVKDRREELGMTQQQLADKIGRTKTWVYTLECGMVKDVSLLVADKIAVALGCKGKTGISRIKQVFSLESDQ